MRHITPINNNGSIQLKFSVSGKRYSFNPIPGADFNTPRDIAQANAIATKISNDVLAGYLDPTLERYRSAPKATLIIKPNLVNLIELWDLWVDSLDLAPATKADHYEMIRRMIVKANPKLDYIDWLDESPIAPATFNKRLGYLKACYQWAIAQGIATANPYNRLKTRKTTASNIKPFNIKEISKIVEGFDRIAPHYSPFVQFLFQTATRLSEAIGLRWGQVDLDRGVLTISESLSKDRTGNGYTRIRKETKSGSVRHLQMTEALKRLLMGLRTADKIPDDVLVFKSIQGCIIDSGNFRALWQEVLKSAGVGYRRLHIIRHTTLSMAIAQGTALTGVAYIAGHKNTRMVMQTYGHLIDAPSLPSFELGC